ncbi:MAG: PilW family protein [Pseudomonadota bacterium]
MTSRPAVPHHASSARSPSQGGFSLIEFMVALAVGLLLVAGLATLFANSSYSGRELEKSLRQIESGQYALDLMGENISMAGYYGDLSTATLARSNPSPCATAVTALGWDSATLTVPSAVQGLTSTEAAALFAATPTCLPSYKTGTAALVTRHLETASATAGTSTNGAAYVQTSRCATDPVATPFIIATASTSFTLKGLSCTSTVMPVQRYVSRLYYVASCNECGVDTIPTLKRMELVSGALVTSPLVEGIDDAAFEFAFDTNSDGLPDAFATTASGASNTWANVVGVRMHVLARSAEASADVVNDAVVSGTAVYNKTYALGLAGTRGPFGDGYKRRAYSMTARLNNVAGPRAQQ